MPKLKGQKNLRIFNETLDGIRIKIISEKYDYFCEKSSKVYTKETFQDLKMENFDGLQLFGKYFIVNFGIIQNGDKHRFDIIDKDKNKYGNVIFALVERKNNISYLELMGLFFKVEDLAQDIYEQNTDLLGRYNLFPDFLKYFKISIYEKKIIKEIHYNIDIIGKECFQIIELMKEEKDYSGYLTEQLTATDLVELKKQKGIIKYGPSTTGLTIKGSYNKLVIYDKILDILKNYVNRKVNGINPYQKYLNSDYPITRIELQKIGNGLQRLQNSSLERILQNIQGLYYDFIKNYFDIDFNKLAPYKINSLNGKTNFIAKEQKKDNIFHSLTMMMSYSKKLKNLLGQKGFEKEVLKMFPELQNKNSLDYCDIFDLKDLFDNI